MPNIINTSFVFIPDHIRPTGIYLKDFSKMVDYRNKPIEVLVDEGVYVFQHTHIIKAIIESINKVADSITKQYYITQYTNDIGDIVVYIGVYNAHVGAVVYGIEITDCVREHRFDIKDHLFINIKSGFNAYRIDIVGSDSITDVRIDDIRSLLFNQFRIIDAYAICDKQPTHNITDVIDSPFRIIKSLFQ